MINVQFEYKSGKIVVTSAYQDTVLRKVTIYDDPQFDHVLDYTPEQAWYVRGVAKTKHGDITYAYTITLRGECLQIQAFNQTEDLWVRELTFAIPVEAWPDFIENLHKR